MNLMPFQNKRFIKHFVETITFIADNLRQTKRHIFALLNGKISSLQLQKVPLLIMTVKLLSATRRTSVHVLEFLGKEDKTAAQ